MRQTEIPGLSLLRSLHPWLNSVAAARVVRVTSDVYGFPSKSKTQSKSNGWTQGLIAYFSKWFVSSQLALSHGHVNLEVGLLVSKTGSGRDWVEHVGGHTSTAG